MISKIKLFFLLFGVFFLGSFCKAQYTTHKLVHAGYVYQNQSFGEIGGGLMFLKKDDLIFRVRASGLLGSVNKKFAIIPKLEGDILVNTEKNVDFYHSYYFLGGAEITTKYIAPKIGISLLGIIDLAAGYAFPIDKKGVNGKELKGLNISFTISIPTVVF